MVSNEIMKNSDVFMSFSLAPDFKELDENVDYEERESDENMRKAGYRSNCQIEQFYISYNK